MTEPANTMRRTLGRILAAPPAAVAHTPIAEQNLRKAVLIMTLGVALFSVLNGVVKDQATRFPVNQIVFFRNALALPPLIVILLATGSIHRLRTRHLRRHITHAATMTASLMLAFIGFRLLPLAEATAISFIRPLIVIALAAPLLGERVTLRSWAAVSLGFAGVLIVAQPGADGLLAVGALYSLAAAFIGALNMLQQRALSLTDHTLGIVVWYMGLSSLLLLPTLFVSWVPPSGAELAGLIGMGLASGVCQYVIMRPLAYAGAAALAPVQYTNLLWSILIGYLWFADVPGPAVLLGSAVVVAATMLVLRGER
ncbi:DMT family transporter [Roseomonas sp. E05]|uniref:DMT family transporter n=1 Tax=Roseomonas sp. E05 TaxID=3046310 RepID=UPI0024BACBC4|nr:DMT family transporter [Roseomonas sp. E05]MDJ0390471.1 DMT family transporter [Roseomonas sp. E05]